MKLIRIKKIEFEKAINSLQNDYAVFIPKEEKDKVVFSEMKSSKDSIDYSFKRANHTIKEFVLPQSETLFYFSKDGLKNKESFDSTKKILLGVRPCDAKTLKLLDFNFLEGGYQDPYYKKRRENTFTIVTSCNEFEINCFCDLLGGGPYKLNGADAIIYDLGDEINLLINNELIFFLFKSYGEFVEEVDNEEEVKEKGKIAKRDIEPLKLEELKEKLSSLIKESSLWKQIEATCIGCGICTYLCPACYCFDVNDINYGKVGKRVRSYDSCMFKEYTLEASGHNPRPTGAERWRQRLMHKFLYYPLLYNDIGCTGCGRCIDNCPSKIDIREVIDYAINYK